MPKKFGAEGHIKKYNDSISAKESLEAARQDMRTEILIRADEGKDTQKQATALKALIFKIDLAEKRIEKSKEDFHADISKHVDNELGDLDQDWETFKIKFSDQLKQAGTHLGMAKKLFESLGPVMSGPRNAIDGIVNRIKIENVEVDPKGFLESFTEAVAANNIENLHVAKQKLNTLKRVKISPTDRRDYEEKLFYRSLRGSLY